MKIIIFILAGFISVAAIAQGDILVKTDGTKYYLQVYDGETNEKVVYYNPAGSSWTSLINVADFFNGSEAQLWSFEESPNFPGYFLVRNRDESVYTTHSLMSWSWNAYLATDESRPPLNEMEKQFRFVEAFDGYFILETIEKPTDGSLYGINYTPGADALNVQNGVLAFSGVKSSDITRENMANKVFKVVEFNPMALFEESIVRGDELYQNNPNAPEKTRYDLFYTLEKAREVRVFGTEGEMLNFQPIIDEAMANFNQVLGLSTMIDDARTFIDASEADDDVKNSFNAIVDEAEEFLNSDDLSYDEIDAVNAKIEGAQHVVEAIIAAQMYGESLVGQDSMLTAGLMVSIDTAKIVLDDLASDASAYSFAITHLKTTQAIIDEIIIANGLIAATQEFEEAKAELGLAVDRAIVVINTIGNLVADLDVALLEMQDAIKAFKRALEAGDTPLELRNAGFDSDFTDWIVESPTPAAAYAQDRGIESSRSITCYGGSAYQMKVYQSVSNIPNGTYIVSFLYRNSDEGSYGLFAESGANIVDFPLPFYNNGDKDLTAAEIEVDVTDGTLRFGVRGQGEDNGVPAGKWVLFDEFEVKWSSNAPVSNGDFANDLTDWLVEGVTAAAYPENKGVDGSRSITCWRGQAYNISVSQILTLANGTYAVSTMAKTNLDSAFVVFGESAGTVMSEPVSGAQLAKAKTIIEVTDGTLKFGVKGAGEGNTVPAGKWIVFDNVEVTRMPDVPVVNGGFDSDLANWIVESPTPAAAYAQNRGIDGSRSITWWKGADYQMKVFQSISNMQNGTYKISFVYRNSAESSIGLFAESGANVLDLPLPAYNNGEQDLTKVEIEITVTDGALDFGVRGQGEDNGVPAGNWIVYDEFKILTKTIIPDYVDFVPTPTPMLVTDIETQSIENKITYWLANQRLNIRSTDVIVKYSVYSITGAMVEQKETRNNNLSIPMSKGVYIVRVLTENGFIDTEKVIIR